MKGEVSIILLVTLIWNQTVAFPTTNPSSRLGRRGLFSAFQAEVDATGTDYSQSAFLPPHVLTSPPDVSVEPVRSFEPHGTPTWLLHMLRDGGIIRSIVDTSPLFLALAFVIENREAARDFVSLTQRKKTLYYGNHRMQFVDLIRPSRGTNRGLVFFVHGGAWGSGMPWLYRLTAKPFIDAGMTVAVVGYRTYPDGSMQDQIEDIEAATDMVFAKYTHLTQRPEELEENEWLGTSIVGHSSGAHISLMMVIDRLHRALEREVKGELYGDQNSFHLDQMIGMSGPYALASHYEFEIGRGVEDISMMKPVCQRTGRSEPFDYYSPAMKLQHVSNYYELKHLPSAKINQIINEMIPSRVLFVHGIEDDSVPFTSSAEAGELLRLCGVKFCEEYYLPETGHQDLVMELMLGGQTRDIVMNWIEFYAKAPTTLTKFSADRKL